jgi:hypothetical protein
VLYGAFGGCRIHHFGDAIQSLNRAALSPQRGLSLLRGRSLDDPKMTEKKSLEPCIGPPVAPVERWRSSALLGGEEATALEDTTGC